MWYWIAIYFYLAQKLRLSNAKVGVHSIIHCVMASALNTYILFGKMNKNILSPYVVAEMQSLDPVYKPYLHFSALHSLGYFIADTLSILYNYNTYPHLRKYLIHHIFSIFAIMTAYWDSYLCVYGIWSLEIGGVVYHMRHAANEIGFNRFWWWVVQILYHIVYITTRILTFTNITNCMLNIGNSNTPLPDTVGIITGYGLVVQNGIWWYKNVQQMLTKG